MLGGQRRQTWVEGGVSFHCMQTWVWGGPWWGAAQADLGVGAGWGVQGAGPGARGRGGHVDCRRSLVVLSSSAVRDISALAFSFIALGVARICSEGAHELRMNAGWGGLCPSQLCASSSPPSGVACAVCSAWMGTFANLKELAAMPCAMGSCFLLTR